MAKCESGILSGKAENHWLRLTKEIKLKVLFPIVSLYFKIGQIAMAFKLSTKEVCSILERYYRIIPETVINLGSYQHANFKVTSKTACVHPNTISEGTTNYVMKLVDTSHFSYCGNTDLQHAMLKHLHTCGIPASFPVATEGGETIVDYYYAGKKYTVQLLTFLEGVCINEADLGQATGKIFSDMGRLSGMFHRALMNLDFDTHKASQIKSPFHAQNALEFEWKLGYVEDAQLRRTLQKHFDTYKRNFIPRLSELRKGFIHGDFSTTNLLLQKPTENGEWEMNGIIDFEECCYGYLVGELGIAVAYAMLKATDDPIGVSRLAIDNYQTIIRLTDSEKDVLFEVVASRMVVSCISACYEASLAPHNTDFLFAQAKNVPTVLKMIEKVGREDVVKAWFAGR